MNHNAPGNQGGETWPVPENNESKRPKKRRKSKSGSRKNGHADSAARLELTPKLENGTSREYSADDLSEAVIWVRDFDPNDTSIKPLINTEQYLASKKEAANPGSVVKSGNNKRPLKKMSNKNSVSQKIEHFEVQTLPEESALTDPQRAEHEPDERRERKYFWNQTDVYQPQNRDVLPAIGNTTNQDEMMADEAVTAENPYGPTLTEAVNPNDPAISVREARAIPDTAAVKTSKNQKSGFIARRREKREVQSQQMEGETFDRIAPANAYNELIPEEAAASEAAVEVLEQPVPPSEVATGPIEVTDRPTGTYPEMPVTSTKEKVDESIAERGQEAANVELELEKSEQLDLARSIQIDGVSVYEMFTAGRIDEAGLHRIIVEFLRGGDLRDVIKSEIIRQQLKFERDPQLRDTPVGGKSAVKATSSKIKSKTKSLVDPVRNRDRTEKLAEFTQNALEKSHEYLDENPKAGQMMSIAAIVVIYLAILIVAIAK